MQFTKGGPDVPERLLQAHEDGRVAFFCGAGISYPAGLPGFKGLVEALYKNLHFQPTAEHTVAIKAGRYDTAIGLLEAAIVDGRQSVRKEVVRILTPPIARPRATATHRALLTLGKTRDGLTRVITTNFDRLFEAVIQTTFPQIDCFCAPLLPVPKKRWDGLIYLHGLLTEEPSSNDLERLVLSSGDFGLAYLTERWAARFVSELFRNYTVCFVGYSLDDPVLRYMMDALAADRLLGESPPEMFAFGVYSKGQETDAERGWTAKNVTPVLYKAHRHHIHLHRTLRQWAETYRDGVRGKQRIVTECAMTHPTTSTKQDNFVARLLWALSDSSGLPAKRFAELKPVPPLDWYEPLSDARFGHYDLNRFGVVPNEAPDENLAFSVASRPPPYTHAPWMTLADKGPQAARWDAVMSHIASWLARHLGDPTLVLRLARLGGRLHDRLSWQFENRIRYITTLEREDKRSELDDIRASAPNAIPGKSMRTLWRLLLTGRVRTGDSDRRLFAWRNRYGRDGLTATLRLELRELLTPLVLLSEPFSWPSAEGDPKEEEHVGNLVDWKIVLSIDAVRAQLQEVRAEDRWHEALPTLLQDFNALLLDALDLMRELGGASAKSDLSYVHQPSISDHSQNRDFHDWTALIEFTRDAWLATCRNSPDRAKMAAETWWQTPYPVFRRLAMFAAAQDGIIPTDRALEWLLQDESWWLWSVETSRESIRLLVSLAPRLDNTQLARLEQAIVAGTPRKMYRPDIETERLDQIRERDIWVRLAKISAAGAQLSEATRNTFRALEKRHPEWQIPDNERDEFSTWMSVSGDWRISVTTPDDPSELAVWLREKEGADPWQQDDWVDRCRKDLDAAASALTALSQHGIWPVRRWGQALHVWSEKELAQRAWDRVASVVGQAPPEHLHGLGHDLGLWLQKVAKICQGQESVFFGLCDRLLALDYEPAADTDDVVGRAINHPVGRVAEALLEYWYRGSLRDDQGLSEEFRTRFSVLCNTGISSFCHGRVLLAAHMISLFRVDRAWAVEHLLPLFDWSESEPEARSAWGGFLWSPQLYRPLVEDFKQAFLDTASHYEELGQLRGQYTALLTFAALDPSDVFTNAELAEATRTLPQDGLEEAAEVLVRAMEGAGDQRSAYWTNRVRMYLDSIWPRTIDKATSSIAESFARVCIATGSAFPDALRVILPWLRPVRYSDRLVHSLHEARLCERFPHEALNLLHHVINTEEPWPADELRECLRAIRRKEPTLGADARFIRLREYLERSGEGL